LKNGDNVKNPVEYIREVRSEVARVTWPTRRETMITTSMVFIFVLIASVFFLLADKLIGFVVQLLLGVS
jgi:preprotein translocase subunit SecE